MEVGVGGADFHDAVLQHQCRGVEVVNRIAGQTQMSRKRWFRGFGTPAAAPRGPLLRPDQDDAASAV
jgi:hypothetical protein